MCDFVGFSLYEARADKNGKERKGLFDIPGCHQCQLSRAHVRYPWQEIFSGRLDIYPYFLPSFCEYLCKTTMVSNMRNDKIEVIGGRRRRDATSFGRRKGQNYICQNKVGKKCKAFFQFIFCLLPSHYLGLAKWKYKIVPHSHKDYIDDTNTKKKKKKTRARL